MVYYFYKIIVEVIVECIGCREVFVLMLCLIFLFLIYLWYSKKINNVRCNFYKKGKIKVENSLVYI